MRELIENSVNQGLIKMGKELDKELNKLIRQSKKLQNEKIIIFDDNDDNSFDII